MYEMTDELIKVYRLPDKLTDGFAFNGGVPITFTNVDWFNGYKGMTQSDLEKHVREKRYFKEGGKFLVLSDSFTFQM
jgi:hypothetical protein